MSCCHVVIRRVFDNPKCDKCAWQPGSARNLLGELQPSSRPPGRNRGKGPTYKGKEGKRRGRERRKGEGDRGESGGEVIGKGRKREREGEGKKIRKGGKIGWGKRRGLPPLYLTSGYGPDFHLGLVLVIGATNRWDQWDASAPTLEIMGTKMKYISSPRNFATGCLFFAGHCGKLTCFVLVQCVSLFTYLLGQL